MSQIMNYRQALNDALREEMARDQSVFLIGEDIGLYGGVFRVTADLMTEFGEHRVRQTPISEAAIVGTAIGAALTGLRPVAEIMYIDFTAVAMDQIVNQAAKLRYMSGGRVTLPMVIRTQGGTGTGESSQHCQSLEAWFVHAPGLHVVMPATPRDAKGLLKFAIRGPNPVMFIEHKFLYNVEGEVPDGDSVIPFGRAEVKRPGDQVTVVATSFMVHRALKVAERLGDRASVEVIDPRTLVPLDLETILNSICKTGRLLVVQEACTRGGFGSEIIRQVVERALHSLKSPPRVLGGRNIPIPYSPPLEKASVPQEEDIEEAILDLACGTLVGR